MLTLYYAPGTCALATHIALQEAGAAYQAVRLDFKREQHKSPEYLRINPKARVPALVTEHGILTETPALLQYVAQLYPSAGLAPLDDPFGLARFNAFNSYLCSTVHVAHAHRMRGARWADEPEAHEAMRRKVPGNMTACFTLIEEGMLEGPWVLGERFTGSDAYLFTLAGWLEGDGVDIARFPKVADHFRRMNARPAVQHVLSAQQAIA